jgi:4-amino-4-deoxy-L-arabinose transferase-like glycosyltransferase
MIANTAVIAKDSVLYIERAQQLPTQFDKISNANEPFGFPALIIASHRLFALFPGSDSNLRWILSGQILVFVCRFVTVGILYLFGKALFDRHRAFWGVLVLIFLPYPAEIGADILRDWPHLLFLFGGLLCLHKGVDWGI